MAVTEQTPRNVSTAVAGATVFPYDFKIIDKADLQVTVDGAAKVVDVDFTVSGVGIDSGGDIAFFTPMAGGEVVMRRRNMAYQRQTDYQHLGDFRTPTLNNDQDAPVMMLQQQAEEIGRAMKLAPDSVGISSQLPAPIALQLLGWNAAGNGVANFSPDAFVTATTAGVAHQYPVTAGQTTIGVQGIVAPFGVGQLFYNGIFQNPAAYSISGGVLTFTEALPVAGVVTIIAVFRSADQITDSDQLFTTPEATGAITRSIRAKLADTVNVLDFGAVGDGVADDLAAFDAALAYAASLGGGRVDVPAGEFRLSGPLVFPDASGLELVGTSKASAGGLNANGATKLIADHTDGAAIRISGENNVLRNLLVGASAARQSGDIDQFGLLVEAADSAGVGARSCLIEGCTFRDHSGHGVVTSGNVYQTRFQSVTVRNCLGHGIMLDEGAVTSRVNVDRPGQISIVDCRTYNVGGHHLRVGSPGGSGGYGAYRIHVENFENSGYETGTYNAALLDEPANSVFYGENIVITGSAFAGMVDEVPALSGIFIEGRAIHVVANRYITVSPNAVILGKGTQPAADIVISGILVSQDVTLNPAVQIGTGVRGVTIFAQNQDQITTAAAGDLTDVVVFREGVFTVGGRVEAARFNSPTATNTYPFEATRADAIIGARFTRTGTGASVARFEASGGGAAVSDNINFLTVKPTTVNISILPTSSAGLSAGDLWNDAGTLKIV